MPNVRLSEELVELLSRPQKGQGGFQDLLKLLQRHTKDGVLSVGTDEAERIVRYVDDYGTGGFQDVLRPLADALRVHPQQ